MSINSPIFLISFSLLLAILSVLQLLRNCLSTASVFQKVLILLYSLFFLIAFDWHFAVCAIVVIVIAYFGGIFIDRKKNIIILFVEVALLLGILIYFKYSGFIINSVKHLLGYDTITLKIILPVGISFYIFSAISYLIDIYKGNCVLEKNILSFSLYIVFFTKLTAGPIVRGKDFFHQLHRYRGVEWGAFTSGLQIYVFGLFKKNVLADHLGVFVDDVFRAPSAFNTATVILAVISYSLQIYFDFSGYSDMAIGLSKILGFDFKPNFNLPYLSRNISEFWSRWHISLSSWFRDYLYIPLGGNRKGALRAYINLLLVMLLSGVWHGAGWTFIAWGALHGMASCVNKAIGKKLSVLGSMFNVMITFFGVTLLWVVFRADSFSNAIEVWRNMFTIHDGISQMYIWSFFAIACLTASSIMCVINSKKKKLTDRNGKLQVDGFYPIFDFSRFWQLVAFFTFCGLTVIMGYYGNTAFIYGVF